MRLLMLIVALLVSGAAVPAVAGPLEDGLEAYEKGDYATALRLWRPLAEQGDADAQSNLGLMYGGCRRTTRRQRRGTARPPSRALRAQSTSWPCTNGQGLTQDSCRRTCGGTSAPPRRARAAKNRDLVARTMTPTMIGEAQKLAREWKPK